jgi:diguanylate cyclase (GGDEF)-like protein
MNRTELERAELVAARELDRVLLPTGRELAGPQDEPEAYVKLLARVLVESNQRGAAEVPIDLALPLGVAVDRMRDAGLGLDQLLELSLAVIAAVGDELQLPGVRRLGRTLVLVLVRAFLDAELADHEEQQQELRSLIGITRAINRTLDPIQVAETGMRETVRAMRVDLGAIWLAPGGTGSLVLAHSIGMPDPVKENLRSIENMGTQGVAAALGGSALVVPLRDRRGQVGLLAVGSRRQRSFDESEVGFVNVVADHLAAALDHAFEHRREAHTDYLTGLANRAEFESSVRRELAAAHRRGRTLSLMAMDLDQLKKINDTQGHHAGDDAIRAVAAVIRKAVRTSDISSRLGGDEFGVAMPDAGLAQAGEVVARIQGMLREHNALTRQPIELELSFGLAEWQPGQNYDTLFQIADRNLYRDKRRHNARRARAAGAAGRLGGSKPSSPSSSLPATHST